MASLDDDEALFEDIYGDDEKSNEISKSAKPDEKQSSDETAAQKDSGDKSSNGTPSDVGTAASTSQPTVPTANTTDTTSQSNEAASYTPGTSSGQMPVPPPPQQYSQVPAPNMIPQMQQSNMPNMMQPPLPPDQNMPAFQQMPPAPPVPVAAQQPQAMPPSQMGRDHGKMFIGGLNWDTTEQGLVEYFSKFGEVVDHTIMRDNATGKSRGFGFLTFKDPKSVDEVIKQDHVLDGKLIDPKRAIAREEQDKVGKIFVGGIDPMVNEKEFNDFFSQFGSIIDAQLMIDKDTGRSRGFGFITYDSPEAVDRVTVNKYLTLKGKSMEVKRAEPRGQHQQNQMQQQQQQQQYNYGMYNPYGQMQYPGMNYNQGMNGMSPEMMQEYWQRMQQWYMYQQQQQQQQQVSNPSVDSNQQSQQEQPENQPLNPQQQSPESHETSDHNQDNSGDNNAHGGPPRRMNLPKGPRRAPPSGPGGSRGRGGYQNRNRGYHPYSRNNRR